MTPKQQEIVRTTFAQLEAHEDRVADLLYQELFRMEPKAREMFRGDMQEQQKKLMRMLRVAVENINDQGQLQPMLYNLGMIHQSYGIEPHHFVSFGSALLFAIHSVLKEHCTKEVEESWKAAYHYFVLTMKNFPHSEDPVQLPHH
ncbi:MAG: globin domain-containing protein [Bacteriovoracaceae bacterium]|nr:globin domain-containing protein [Bacteroidota bacterium]